MRYRLLRSARRARLARSPREAVMPHRWRSRLATPAYPRARAPLRGGVNGMPACARPSVYAPPIRGTRAGQGARRRSPVALSFQTDRSASAPALLQGDPCSLFTHSPHPTRHRTSLRLVGASRQGSSSLYRSAPCPSHARMTAEGTRATGRPLAALTRRTQARLPRPGPGPVVPPRLTVTSTRHPAPGPQGPPIRPQPERSPATAAMTHRRASSVHSMSARRLPRWVASRPSSSGCETYGRHTQMLIRSL